MESAPSFRMWGDGHFLFFAGQSERPTGHFFGRGNALAFGEKEDGVDRVGIVDVIGRDARGVGGARGLGGQFFVKEAALLNVAAKTLPSRMYWLPIAEARFSQRGFSGSAGGLDGFGEM